MNKYIYIPFLLGCLIGAFYVLALKLISIFVMPLSKEVFILSSLSYLFGISGMYIMLLFIMTMNKKLMNQRKVKI